MKNGYLFHHLGLGDHIISNGMVRELINSGNYDTLIYPVKNHNFLNIQTMLKDMEDIIILPVQDDHDMIRKYQNIYLPVRLGSFEQPNFMRTAETFCKAFYRQASVPYERRWESFRISRNEKKEEALRVSIDFKYVFVHDDFSRNFAINRNFKYRVYRPSHNLGNNSENTIFDYIKVLEDAEEIHCMDSSFAALIDHLPQLKDKPKFIHRYIRKNSANPFYKNGWTVLNE